MKRASVAIGKAVDVGLATQPERDLQGVCHELLEIIEGQEYIIEDGQFALSYGVRLNPDPRFGGPFNFQTEAEGMVEKMEEVKAIAQTLYDKTFNCKRARQRAGLEVER